MVKMTFFYISGFKDTFEVTEGMDLLLMDKLEKEGFKKGLTIKINGKPVIVNMGNVERITIE